MLSSLILGSDKKVINWVSTGISSEKIKPFDTNLEPTLSNLTNCKVILKFSNFVLVQKRFPSLHGNFILNLYIFYELNARPRNPTNNFTSKIFLFGTVKLARNAGKSKCTYNGWGIAFDGKGFWSFDNDKARNVVIFCVDNSWSSHIDYPKNNFLVLGEWPTEGINGSVGTPEKKVGINFSKAITKFCLSLHCNGDESYLYANKTKIYEFKARYNVIWYNFWLRSVSKDFTTDLKSKIFLNNTVYDFSVNYNSIKKKIFLIFTNI